MCGAGSTSYSNKTNKRVSFISQSLMIMEIYAPQMPRFPIQENSRPYERDFLTNHHPLPMTWMPRPCTSQVPPKTKHCTPIENRRPLHPTSWLQGINVMASRRFLNYLCAEIHPFCIPNDFLFTDIQYRWLAKKQQRLKMETLCPNQIDYMGENGWYIPDSAGAMSPRKIIS